MTLLLLSLAGWFDNQHQDKTKHCEDIKRYYNDPVRRSLYIYAPLYMIDQHYPPSVKYAAKLIVEFICPN